MYSYFTFFIILQCFVYNLPSSFGQDDFRYTNCSQPLDCGDIRNISFPFWGYNRARYCGQPGYELRCEDDRIELVTEAQTYRVLNVNNATRRLHIIPVDTQTDSCPAPSVNISFPAQTFTYSLPDTFNITLFYGCPPISTPSAFSYPCSPNDNSTSNYIWTGLQSPGNGSAEIWQCELIVRVPILQRLADTVGGNNLVSLQQVLRSGFEVGYTTNFTFCRRCQDSGGHCGYNWNTTRPTCFCYDTGYESSCPTPRPDRTRFYVPLKIIIDTIFSTIDVIKGGLCTTIVYTTNKKT